MAKQALITINEDQWQVAITETLEELTVGLGGLTGLPAGHGMLFDTGGAQIITVTTGPMLFPLDIAFLSEDLVVTEVYHGVAPGYLVTAEASARYFFEVNAGELDGVTVGDTAAVAYLPGEAPPEAEGEVSVLATFASAVLIGSVIIGAGKLLYQAIKGEPETFECREEGCDTGECEIVTPQHFNLLSWFGAPVPDYSFSIEPERKERKLDQVLKQLKTGVDEIQDSANFREFLVTMSKFHDYSIGNLMLITLQKPNATRVAGFNTWKDLGRSVKKGEKGIAILAPCRSSGKVKVRDQEASAETTDEDETASEEVRPIYFKVVHVFDISQTEGKELPEVEVPSLTGTANEELFESVVALGRGQGLEISFASMPDQDDALKGYYTGKMIWVRPEEARAQQLKTLLHEMAHHYSEGVFQMSRKDAETIAESVAFTVGAHFGFDSGTRSFPYVALWARDKQVLERNLAAIRKVTASMIDDLEKQAKTAVTGALIR